MSASPDAHLSYYLSLEEIEVLAGILREQCCKARSSAVVQVFGTDPPYFDNWTQRCCGLAIFVADSTRRSFFIQVYDPTVGEKLFEQEFYKEFLYVADSPFFHQFEGDNEVIGLNFAYQEEASVFAEAVFALIDKRKLKAERNLRNAEQEKAIPSQEPSGLSQQPSVVMRDTISHSDKRAKRTKKIRKSEIGNPENFVHVCHVGYNASETTSPAKNQEAILATILQLSNIQPKELEDEKTKEVFLTFIESNGGLEKVYKKLKSKTTNKSFSNFSHASFLKKKKTTISRPRAPLPELPEGSPTSSELQCAADVSPAPQNSSPGGFSGWNRIVNNEQTTSTVAPSHHKKELPPLPTQPQLQLRNETNRSLSVPYGKSATAPPPPPPPPTDQSPKIVPELPNCPLMKRSLSLPPGGSTNKTILPQEPNEEAAGRDDLLNQIRNPGFRLKKVEHVANEKTHSSGFENSLIASLAQTLEGRSRACRGNSSSEETESEEGSNEDSDDWED